MFIQAENLNEAFIRLCKALITDGVDVTRRGFKCREIPSAVLVEITNPTDRYIRIPERKWNKTLGWIESLWIARGDIRLEMPAAYVKNLLNFSDDGLIMRAGYGARIRRYGDNINSMANLTAGQTTYRQYAPFGKIEGGQDKTDQLRFIIEKFKEDIDTREAVITIHDPVADDFDAQSVKDGKAMILKTKDTPCTRSIHFMVVNGKMNCYVDIRSNDIWWGFSAVNIFNFTLMQEYVAAMVGVPIGTYYHKIDNLHVYEDFLSKVKEIAEKYDVSAYPSGIRFAYTPMYHTLDEFDRNIQKLSAFEKECRENKLSVESLADTYFIDKFEDPLFADWAKVIFRYWTKYNVEFVNPFLNELFLKL